MEKLKVGDDELFFRYPSNSGKVQEGFDIIITTAKLLGYNITEHSSFSTVWEKFSLNLYSEDKTIKVFIKSYSCMIQKIEFEFRNPFGLIDKFNYEDNNSLESILEKFNKVLHYL